MLFSRGYLVCRSLSNSLSTCSAQPSSSADINAKLSTPLPYSEFIKTKYPTKLEELDGQVKTLNEERRKNRVKASTKLFLKNLADAIINHSSAELLIVGSMATQFVNKQSDFDFVFFPKNDKTRLKFLKDFHQNPSFKQHFMSVFAKLINRESDRLGESIEKIVELPRLRVPLLIVRYKSGLSIDIQFPEENYHAVRNTHLVKCYKHCDIRFTLLFLWLREICDKLEIRNSKYGLLSSYHLLLLVIHFLQSEQALSPWPVLPVLTKTHSNLVTPEMPISEVVRFIQNDKYSIIWDSHNKMPISELIVKFVDYYYHFDPSKEAIYIEKGLAQKRKQTFGDVRLQIIDPYSPSSVCRSQHATSAFFTAMGFIRHKMKHGEMINCLPNVSEAVQFKRDTTFSKWRTQMQDKVIL